MLLSSKDCRMGYDEFAPDYDRFVMEENGFEIPQSLAFQLFGHLAGNELVLDVGCGTGQVGRSLLGLGWGGTLVGCDISYNMLMEARQKNVYSKVLQMNAYSLAFSDGSFDVVVSSALIGITGPTSIREMLRLVKPGGIFACTICEAGLKASKKNQQRSRGCIACINTTRWAKVLTTTNLGGGYKLTNNFDDVEKHVLYIIKKQHR